MTGTKLGVFGLAVLLACCLAVAGCGGGGEATTAAGPSAVSQRPSQAQSAPKPAGPSAGAQRASEAQSAPKPDGPVVIEAYYPLNASHKFIVDYLKSVEAANPGKVSVTVHDMQGEEGRAKWTASGLGCAGVFVNGSTRHEIDSDGTKETVDFLKRMDVFWSKDDFETVMTQEMAKAGETFQAPSPEGGRSE